MEPLHILCTLRLRDSTVVYMSTKLQLLLFFFCSVALCYHSAQENTRFSCFLYSEVRADT